MTFALDKSTWKRVTFGDVVKNVNETDKALTSEDVVRVIAMEHLDPGELLIRRWGDLQDGTTFTRRVRPGQTLFGKRRAYQRKAAFAEFEAICSGDILVFEAKTGVMLPEFLPFLVQSNGFYDHALGTSAGSLSPRTNWRDLSDYGFALPPLDEQGRLADLLWAVVRHKRSLTHLASSASASLTPLMTASVDGERTVADVVTTARSGATPLRSNKRLYGGSIPWLKSGEVVGDAISVTQETITPEALEMSATWLVPPGAVLVAMYGDGKTRGQVGRTAIPMATNQAVLALVPDEAKCDPDFFYYWMRSRQEALRAKGAGAAQKNLSKAAVVSEPFPSLSIEDQRETVSRLQAVDEATARIRDEGERLILVLKSLAQEIFADAV